MTWIDITMPLNNKIAHWPGDTPFSYSLSATKEETGSVNVGSITMSTHTGTHADAPYHYKNNGSKINDLPLELYIGKAMVINAIGASSLDRSLFEQFPLENKTRLLIKTTENRNLEEFSSDFPTVTPNGAAYLAEQGIKLIGVDAPSVDSITSKDLPGHHSLDQAGIAILENLVLDQIAEGIYELIALPLLLHGADGSPVRAVIKLIKEGFDSNDK
ncbi:arylformamidase [Shouchella patagoniensis]|uniref:arylformamidase n=1 Tax=Shouchella patagoniensis TaxID=228576 RepID=UPI0011161590|nr:arylformamidase [Shouchella patagoniensis]